MSAWSTFEGIPHVTLLHTSNSTHTHTHTLISKDGAGGVVVLVKPQNDYKKKEQLDSLPLDLCLAFLSGHVDKWTLHWLFVIV